MGFMDKLKNLTTPYDDDDDFFEGADIPYNKTPAAPSGNSSQQFEDIFAVGPGTAPEAPQEQEKTAAPQGSFFGGLGGKKTGSFKASGKREGTDSQVILFNPKNFDDAGELVTYLLQNRSVVMTLEGVPTENARRLLDFLSGIAFALQGKITPVSAKTYFVTPQNVDVVGAQKDTAASDEGSYF